MKNRLHEGEHFDARRYGTLTENGCLFSATAVRFCLFAGHSDSFHHSVHRSKYCISNYKSNYLYLKVHFRYLAVNFLPQNFITLLLSLIHVLTITRRKRPKSGPTTSFQCDFCTLLIICVPPIILGQVLRYFPTVIACI